METQLANRYQLIKPLGGGGFGQTFLAEDLYLPHRPCCVVKQLKPKSTDTNSQIIAKRLFTQEAEILHRLGHHDQIPSLLAYFEQDQEFYLVQDYIQGQPLNEMIRQGQPWAEGNVLILLLEILQVLAFVHQNNVIHRDLKPANLIRRQPDHKIILIDFGAVKEVSVCSVNGTGETTLTVAVGTPNYMPSEQQAFKPKFSSDIYAVGIIALQALSGLSPRQLPQDQNGEFTCSKLPTLAPINPKFAAILDKMVRYDYRQRYPSATEAFLALQELQSGFDQSTIAMRPEETISTLITPNSDFNTASTVLVSASLPSRISDSFKERCRQALADAIGPFANFLVEDTLTEFPQLTPEQFVEQLATNIPDKAQAQTFRKKVL